MRWRFNDHMHLYLRITNVKIMTQSEIETIKEAEQDEDFFWEDEDSFQCCDNCDLPDACCDFGCAIQQGLKKDFN